MINAIGWYCFVFACLQFVALLAGVADKVVTEDRKKRRALVWIAHPIFLGVAVLCWK